MSHSFSRSWKSPAVVARERWTRILKSRDHLCPDSPYLPAAFELDKHRAIMASARHIHATRKALSSANDASVRTDRYTSSGRPPPAPARDPPHNRSAVQALPTIWSPSWPAPDQRIAPWPGTAEMRAQGDERVASGVKAARCLARPRMPSEEPEWAKIPPMPRYEFDIFGTAARHSQLRCFECGGGELEALALLGEELMAALDPVEIYG